KSHLRDRRRGEVGDGVQPPIGADVIGVSRPRTGEEEVDVEEMTHGSSFRMALTRSGVMAGAPGGATKTGRPNLPRTSRARFGCSRWRTSFSPSIENETLSPAWRCKAFRKRWGMTNWPLVEMVTVLIV